LYIQYISFNIPDYSFKELIKFSYRICATANLTSVSEDSRKFNPQTSLAVSPLIIVLLRMS